MKRRPIPPPGRLAASLLLAAALLPLAWVAGGALAAAGRLLTTGEPPLDAVETRLWFRSLGIAGLATLLAAALGIPYGWLLGRGRLPGGRFWAAISLAPLLLPPYGLVIAALYLHERFGATLVTPAWAGLALGLPATLATAAAVLAAGTWPAVAWFVLLAARSVPPELEDAARLECRDRRAAWFAAWPFVRPALLGGLLFVFLLGFANYTVGDALWLPTFAREILMQFMIEPTPATAARVGSAALLVALPLVALQRGWLLRVPLAPGAVARPPRDRPSFPGLLFCGAVAGVTAVLPLALLARHSLEHDGLRLALAEAREPLLQSGLTALAAAALALLLALLAAGRRRAGWDLAATLPYALPGGLLAVAIVWLVNRPGALGDFYATPGPLIWGHALLFLPYAYWAVAPAWGRIDPDLEADAALNGAGFWPRWRHVRWPALRGPALLGAALVFLLAAREMEATVILKPPAPFYPLAYAIWDALHFGSREQAAGLCLLMALGGFLVAGALLALAARRGD